MIKFKTAVAVVGGGPAGSAASIALSQKGINHLVFEKSTFPRDKICGDALSGKVVQLLGRMNKDWPELLASEAQSLPSHGVIFIAPNGKELEIPFSFEPKAGALAPGFVSPRLSFDNWLLQRAIDCGGMVHQNTAISTVSRTAEGFTLKGNSPQGEVEVECKMLIGAGGDRCPVARFSGIKVMEPQHYCAGIRGYYSGVQDLHPNGFIELHFIPEFLPGYLWVFPMTDGRANVGAGILSKEASRRKFNLRVELENTLRSHPRLAGRFKHAELQGKLEGWGLPLGSKYRPLHGEGFLLTGDSASLIDPFTGEGIGNAMLSGYEAGLITVKALETNDTGEELLSQYSKRIYHLLADELKTSTILQKLTKYQWLFNTVVSRAAKSETLRRTISSMFEDVEARKQFRNPVFYIKLLTGR